MENNTPSTKPYIAKINILDLISSPGFYYKYIDLIEKTESPKYLHYREIKDSILIPEEFDQKSEKFWLVVKFHRKIHGIKIRICDSLNRLFTWQRIGNYDKLFFEIDSIKESYLKNFPAKHHGRALIEEAIASSQLSGSYLSTKAARKIFESSKIPKSLTKRMIYNNFELLKAIDEKYRNKRLTLNNLGDFHKILLKNIEKEEKLGKLSNIYDQFVQKEIGKLLIFANNDAPDEHFLHPILKAIIIHFWFILLSPFDQGNKRIARALFYWYLFRNGYNIFRILPISTIIKTNELDYLKSYQLTLEDDNNLNYFIDFQIRKIEKTLNHFRDHLKQKNREDKEITGLVGHDNSINFRQTQILSLLKNHPTTKFSQSSHKFTHQITKATAIKDIKALVKLGLIVGKKEGRNIFYHLKTPVRDK